MLSHTLFEVDGVVVCVLGCVVKGTGAALWYRLKRAISRVMVLASMGHNLTYWESRAKYLPHP